MGRICRSAALVLGLAALSGCSGGDAHREREPIALAAERKGLSLRATLSATERSLNVETLVRNNRRTPVYLDTDQCGRVTEAVTARTQREPEGRTWSGSLQAAKSLVLDDQRSSSSAQRFGPRKPGDTSSDVPACVRPKRPVKLGAGEEIAERWELPLSAAYVLAEVGSAGSAIRVDVVEAKAPGELHLLDILPTDSEEEARAGRNVRVEEPTSSVIDYEPPYPPSGPTDAELYDLLVEDSELRAWIEQQPADSWELATVTQVPPRVQLRLVSTEYERAALATANPDGTDVSVELPTERERTRVYERRPGTLPPGIDVIPERDNYVLGDDVLAGSIELPSGRVMVGEYLDDKPLDFRVEPGAYPVHATLGLYRGTEAVALGTLVLSEQETVRWEPATPIAVDGGTASFISPEGDALLDETFTQSEDAWWRLHDRIFDALLAHEYLVTQYALSPHFDLAQFSSGTGDGVYPVYVGLDAAERPTRVVMDFYLLHLDWPS